MHSYIETTKTHKQTPTAGEDDTNFKTKLKQVQYTNEWAHQFEHTLITMKHQIRIIVSGICNQDLFITIDYMISKHWKKNVFENNNFNNKLIIKK